MLTILELSIIKLFDIFKNLLVNNVNIGHNLRFHESNDSKYK